MIQEWLEWGLNEINRCCLYIYIETAPVYFIPNPFLFILVSWLEWPANVRNGFQMKGITLWRIQQWHGMMEWQRNEVIFRIKGLTLVQKSPFIPHHSVIPGWQDWLESKFKWLEWLLNEITSIVIIIPFHLRNDGMMLEWRNEEEWSCFWRGEKKLNSEMPVILPSFLHSNIIPCWWELLTENVILRLEWARIGSFSWN